MTILTKLCCTLDIFIHTSRGVELIYAVGGANEYGALDTVDIYDTLTDTWSNANHMPTPKLNVVQDDTESVVNEGEDGNEQMGPQEREVANCPAVDVEKSQRGEYELQ